MPDTPLAAAIFLGTYALIVSERFHRAAAALAGATLMIAFRILNQDEAFAAIDLDVIFLLMGMMIIVQVLGRTGIFQWLAVHSARLGKGQPLRTLIILSLVTAVASAFLDNVTTVVLLVPVTIFVANGLRVSAIPFLISEAFASNIGGGATLVGDPPNIIVASHTGLTFNEFLVHLAPIVVVLLAAYLLLARFLFFRGATVDEDARRQLLAVDERELIVNPALLKTSLAVLALVVVGFVLHGPLGYEPATVALLGATALLLLTRIEPQIALRDVEWGTLIFFIGLFIVVGGVTKVGILDHVGSGIADLTRGSTSAAAILLLWASAALSGIVDNIPYTTAMLPVVDKLNAATQARSNVLWWALLLGANLGGNLTLVAASANVIVAGEAERAGQRISFMEFARYGVPVTLGSMALCSAYVWLRYLL